MDLSNAKLVKADVDGWIKSVDQKVSILLAFTVAIMALTAKPVYVFLTDLFPLQSVIGWIVLVESCFLLLYSALKSLHALIPRIKMPDNLSSLIYFGSIAAENSEDYQAVAMKMTAAKYKKDLLNQIHINSVICKKKHVQLSDAIILLILGGTGIGMTMCIGWIEGVI